MSDTLRLQVPVSPCKPNKHPSQQVNFKHKETALPIRTPEGSQLRPTQSV